MFASGSQIDAPAQPAAAERSGQYRAKCWNRPLAEDRGFLAHGFPPDSRAMMHNARSTSEAGKCCATNGRHCSTFDPMPRCTFGAHLNPRTLEQGCLRSQSARSVHKASRIPGSAAGPSNWASKRTSHPANHSPSWASVWNGKRRRRASRIAEIASWVGGQANRSSRTGQRPIRPHVQPSSQHQSRRVTVAVRPLWRDVHDKRATSALQSTFS